MTRGVLPRHAVQRSAHIWRLWRIPAQGRCPPAAGPVVRPWRGGQVERAVCFELVLQPGPDSAFHEATQWPGQRAEHPHPAPRAHLPVPAHDCAFAVGSEGQRPGGFHHRAGCARTEPMRPVELGQLHQHLRARPAHACAEPCPQPDRQRSEQLHTSHRWVERRLVARVGDRVKYLLGRRRDADMTGDVGHGSTVSGRCPRDRITQGSLRRPTGQLAHAQWRRRRTDTGSAARRGTSSTACISRARSSLM